MEVKCYLCNVESKRQLTKRRIKVLPQYDRDRILFLWVSNTEELTGEVGADGIENSPQINFAGNIRAFRTIYENL